MHMHLNIHPQNGSRSKQSKACMHALMHMHQHTHTHTHTHTHRAALSFMHAHMPAVRNDLTQKQRTTDVCHSARTCIYPHIYTSEHTKESKTQVLCTVLILDSHIYIHMYRNIMTYISSSTDVPRVGGTQKERRGGAPCSGSRSRSREGRSLGAGLIGICTKRMRMHGGTAAAAFASQRLMFECGIDWYMYKTHVYAWRNSGSCVRCPEG
jgi:hypothetical protein